MKARKVLNFRTHVGGLHGKTSFDSVKNKADMELCAVGVLIKTLEGAPVMVNGKKVEILVPYPNATEIILAPEEIDDEKRGPGRPKIVA